ncbi:MAG: chorismate mutase [Acidobacteriota bacterium]|nr:chorismate mutase [Blastocatellia bacterium]MDW8412812.1 chorismate mutase [Acidobacteriota bacterium]
MDIDDWREEIDRIDLELLELLNRRSRCAIEIGYIKHRMGLPIYSPSRETEILENVTRNNRGPLENDAVRRLFERIIDESRRAERLVVESLKENSSDSSDAAEGN